MEKININNISFSIKPTPSVLTFSSPIANMYDVVANLAVKQINGTRLTKEEEITLDVYGKALGRLDD